jgi:hypothetical protein
MFNGNGQLLFDPVEVKKINELCDVYITAKLLELSQFADTTSSP